MRFVALLIIFVCISMIGIILGNSFKLRVKELQEFESIFHSLRNNITFMRTPIANALRDSCPKDSELSKNFHRIADDIDRGDFYSLVDVAKNAFESDKLKLYLNESDLDMIYDFFGNLENNNVNSFENVFTMFTKRVEAQLSEAIEVKNKNRKVYSSLGIGIAAMIVIFLI